MIENFSEDVEGKKVVHGDETVGRVVDVRQGTAYVDPDPGITETIMSKLSWGDQASDEETYPLQVESVATVEDDVVTLKENL